MPTLWSIGVRPQKRTSAWNVSRPDQPPAFQEQWNDNLNNAPQECEESVIVDVGIATEEAGAAFQCSQMTLIIIHCEEQE